MKSSSAFKEFCSIVFATLGYALILGGVAAIFSDFFDWNLALSIGGSDIAIPADRYIGVSFIILGATIKALHFFWAEITAFLKKHRIAVISLSVLVILGLAFGGKHLITYLDGGPAITAAMNNDTETLSELFANGEVSHADFNPMMMWAAQKGHVETIKLLLENKVSPNATRDDGLSALEAACAWGGEESVQLLKDAGARGECPSS